MPATEVAASVEETVATPTAINRECVLREVTSYSSSKLG